MRIRSRKKIQNILESLREFWSVRCHIGRLENQKRGRSQTRLHFTWWASAQPTHIRCCLEFEVRTVSGTLFFSAQQGSAESRVLRLRGSLGNGGYQIRDSRFKGAATMRFNQSDIIEDILKHIGQCGGECSEWCVGTAKDSHAPFFLRHAAADLGDGLICREAYTTYAAAEVVDRLQASGLRPDRNSPLPETSCSFTAPPAQVPRPRLLAA